MSVWRKFSDLYGNCFMGYSRSFLFSRQSQRWKSRGWVRIWIGTLILGAVFLAISPSKESPPKMETRTVLMVAWHYEPLWWDPFSDISTCPLPCTVTYDRKRIPEADVVLFEMPLITKESPLPEKPFGQVWVGHCLENVHRTVAFKNSKFMSQIDAISSYQRNSSFPALYCPFSAADYETLFDIPIPEKEDNALVAWFGSNCNAKDRLHYIEELQKYIKVDSYGSCLHNTDIPGMKGSTRKLPEYQRLKTKVISKYYFYLSFENSIEYDYVSEKIFYTFFAGAVPVWYGTPNIDEFLPFKNTSIVKTSQFPSPKELAEFLIKAAQDRTIYDSFFSWKQERKLRPGFREQMRLCGENVYCRICKSVLEKKMKDI